MATPQDLWYAQWLPSPTRPGIPAMDMQSHLELNGTLRASPKRSTLPPASMAGHSKLPGGTASALARSPGRMTTPSKGDIRKVWDEKTKSPAWSSCGRTFISRYSAEQYYGKTVMHEEELRESMRQSLRGSRTAPRMSAADAVSQSPRALGNGVIVLGRPFMDDGEQDYAPDSARRTVGRESSDSTKILSRSGLGTACRPRLDAEMDSVLDAPVPVVTRKTYGSILDHPESAYAQLWHAVRPS